MIQGKADPRRPDKVQRYKAPQANGNNPVEDLTPDYMNILGPESTSRPAASASTEPVRSADEEPSSAPVPMECDANTVNNAIPTSPQYGVAIITNNTDTVTTDPTLSHAQDAVTDVTNHKDVVMHSTPSRTNHITNSNNDRFKVVKIATLEPFRRGRWKCMDYVDENPPTICKTTNNNVATQQQQPQQQQQQQQYIQTQSLPPQHFQQMQQQFYQTGAQVQFFYPPQSSAQPQTTTTTATTFISGSGAHAQLPPGATAGATYYQQVIPNSSGGMTLVNYPGVQYVPANLLQQTPAGSAFVPTSQNINNMQQGQTYGGQPSSVSAATQQQPPPQQQPLLNGHAFPPSTPATDQQQQQQQQAAAGGVAAQQSATVANALPTHTQVAKSVILGAQQQQVGGIQQQQQPVPAAQYAVSQQQTAPASTVFQSNTSTQVTPVPSAIVTPSSIQPPSVSNQTASIATTVTNTNNILGPSPLDTSSAAAAAAAVYSNPQFVASVNKIVESAVSMIDAAAANANINPIQRGQQDHPNADPQVGGEPTNGDPTGPTGSTSTSGEDTTTKANPVVNAIDNKIEQAMDLVKSHLMFTVREEVEVLKEKIAELMERIQQLESENNMLRFQMPSQQKQHVVIQQQQHSHQQSACNSNLSTDTSPSSGQQQQQQQQQQPQQQ